MILRRITEHVKTQNWFAVAIDFIIVVVGVFIGIQVSNWNADQTNKRAAREYVVRIQRELLANQQDMATRTEYFSRVKNHALFSTITWINWAAEERWSKATRNDKRFCWRWQRPWLTNWASRHNGRIPTNDPAPHHHVNDQNWFAFRIGLVITPANYAEIRGQFT